MDNLVLPLPPTINQTYMPKGNRLIKKPKAREWEKEVGYMLLPLRPKKPLKGQLYAITTMFLKYDRDIDSSMKLLFDLLEKMKFYDNDKQIITAPPIKRLKQNNPRLEVILKKLTTKKDFMTEMGKAVDKGIDWNNLDND